MWTTLRSAAVGEFDRPDTLFAFVAGLYVALLVSPGLFVVVGAVLPAGGTLVAVGLLLTVPAVVAAVSVGVRRWLGLPERLGTTSAAWLLPVVGGVAAVGYFAVGASDTVPSAVGGAGMAGFFCALGAGFLGFVLVSMSRTRYAAAVVDESTVEWTWEAGWPRRRRLAVAGVVTSLVVFQAALVLAALLTAFEWPFGVLPMALAAALLPVGQERTYRLAGAGLERRSPVARRFVPWRGLAGVTVTDDAVRLERRSPWRPAIVCARDDIEDDGLDVERVVAALRERIEGS